MISEREAIAPLQRAAVAVIALVGALPEKLVHQVAVGAVDFHRIKAQCPGIRRALAEGCHYIIDVLLAHDMAVHLAGDVHPGGRVAVHLTLRRRAGAAHAAAMPQLGCDLAALGMYSIRHLFPGVEALGAVEVRHVGVAAGGDMIDAGALGDDQANPAGGPAPVVVDAHRAREYSPVICCGS